jgi:plasmid stabilization system protein ParE
MARIVVTELADADTANILADIAREAGSHVAEKYNLEIERLYERLAAYPESCAARPKLGAHIRVGVIFPYLVICRHVTGDNVVAIIRVVNGRRKITRRLLRGV